jgi:hypothetical protein
MKRTVLKVTLVLVLALAGFATYHVYKPLPPGLDMATPAREASNVEFLADKTYVDASGQRQMDQEIFDAIFAMIAGARQFVLVDMFLFNDFQGELTATHRALSSELTDALIAQKELYPDIKMVVISDPLNTLYGGMQSPHFARLQAAGITVTLTDLTRLRDSNPLYSALWRPFIQPFGNDSESDTLPNPLGDGRVSLRSYLALLNFKANHRKVVIADNGDQLSALVTSANPHDGSSAHGNVALRFSGPATGDLLASEAAVLEFSGSSMPATGVKTESIGGETGLSVQVVTERAVERAVLKLINGASAGEYLDLAMFYLSDRDVVGALKEAAVRGVKLRVLLDPNKDAFGREKNGVPNRPVAHELVDAGVEVRWCNTQGEQCHAKWLLHRDSNGQASMLLGSTNFTRRNMHNLNLETSTLLRGPLAAEPLQKGHQWFEQRWHNRDEQKFSVGYAVYADESLWHRFLYRVMEATGVSTF